MFVYYLQIFSAVFYLMFIQLRGELGMTVKQSLRDRHKVDALEYYKIDIYWFSFHFVNLGLHFYTIWISWDQLNLMLCIIILSALRIFSIFFLSPFRDQQRVIVEHSIFKWIFILTFLFVTVLIRVY